MSVLSIIKNSRARTSRPAAPSYTKLTREKSVENGIASFVTCYKEYEFANEQKSFDFRLFSMSNLMSVGADKKLTPVRFHEHEISVADKLQNVNFAQETPKTE